MPTISTFATPEPITAVLDLGVADVHVVAADRADTVVEVGPADPGDASDVAAAGRASVMFADGELRIDGGKPGPLTGVAGRAGSEAVRVRVELPAGSDLRAEAQMADVVCEGRLGATSVVSGFGALRVDGTGPLVLKTGLGRIDVGLAEGPAEVATGSGVVHVRVVDGPLTVRNSNGITRIGTVTGRLAVEAANGEVTVGLAAGGGRLRSSNGGVAVAEAAGDELVVETALGDIEIGVRAGLAVGLDVSTTIGTFFDELAAGAAGGGSGRSGAVGAAADAADVLPAAAPMLRVRAHTQVGDIVVRRATAHDGDE